MKLINLFAFIKILFIRNLLISKLVVYYVLAIVQMMSRYISCMKRGRSLALVKKRPKNAKHKLIIYKKSNLL